MLTFSYFLITSSIFFTVYFYANSHVAEDVKTFEEKKEIDVKWANNLIDKILK